MSIVPMLKPGVTIYRSGDFARGTLTCFARKSGIHELYGVTAKHVLPQGYTCTIGGTDPATGRLASLEIGGSPTPIAGVDLVYFKIHDSVRAQLTQDNFIPLGYTVEPVQIWNPGKLAQKVSQAPDQSVAAPLMTKELPIEFVGATQVLQGSIRTAGDIGKYSKEGRTTNIKNTTIAEGDSGGCVLDRAKLRYVGLISCGDSASRSTTGGVVLLHGAFYDAGIILATWADRNDWQ